MGVGHIIEAAFNVRIDHPPLPSSGVGKQIDLGDSVMAASAWAEPVTRLFKSGFPERLKCVLDAGLQAAIKDGGDSERAEFAVRFGDVYATRRLCAPGLRRG